VNWGAKEAGHEVEILHVGKMKINGCLACEYCHGKGEGTCHLQKRCNSGKIQERNREIGPPVLTDDPIFMQNPIIYK
jgi:hypothetical protein